MSEQISLDERIEIYQYTPLEKSTHIRILQLEPGEREDPLRCRIEHVDVNSGADYSAISYVWGDPDKPFRMKVGKNRYIPLTASLYDVFRNLRCIKTVSKTFWADQICINQDDLDERSAQVSGMGSVYRNATEVITYIGPATAEDYEGIRLARMLHEFGVQHMDEEIDRWEIKNSLIEDKFPDVQLPASTETCWEALHKLLVRPWSRRSWIFQENIVNDNVIMVYGTHALP